MIINNFLSNSAHSIYTTANLIQETQVHILPDYTKKLFDFGVSDKLDQFLEPLKTISDFLSYILHPSKLGMLIWNWTLGMSYWVCLFICIGSLLLYILGHKKPAKFVPISLFVYMLIQSINSALR